LRALPLESSIIWSHRPTVKILEGILVRHVKDNVQLVVPQTLRRRLFDALHSGPLAAHLGAERMIKQLKSQYYWPGLNKDVHTWCQQRHQCQSSKGPPARPHGRLQKVITGEPMDIGLPLATDGSKYILVATDYFTKWSEAYPLPDAEAHTCMTALYSNFFSRF